MSSTSPPAESRLNPARIRLARERAGLSKVALAARLGVTTRALQTYETKGAPRSRRDELSTALEVAPAFFDRPARDAISLDQGFFRARRRATAKQLTSARAAASIGIELYEWVVARFRLPDVVVPDLDGELPEVAAATLRAMWGRGDEPLPNLVQLSEAHGVRVLSLPSDAEAVDAFSLWNDGSPYVLLSKAKSAERSRFDLAHELGHLVMHSRVAVGAEPRALEREADEFASALLMPRDAVAVRAGREPAVPEILRLRSHYRVSAMAMTRRLHDIGRLTDWAYRQDCIHLAQRGFRSGEPGGMTRERSRVFGVVFPHRDSAVGEACRELGITRRELHGLTLGHVPVSIDGVGQPVPPVARSLRLVR